MYNPDGSAYIIDSENDSLSNISATENCLASGKLNSKSLLAALDPSVPPPQFTRTISAFANSTVQHSMSDRFESALSLALSTRSN